MSEAPFKLLGRLTPLDELPTTGAPLMNCRKDWLAAAVRTSLVMVAYAGAPTSLYAANELADPTIVASATAFPTYEASFLLDESFATDYASQGQAANTFVDFDFGAATLITQVLYTDRTTSGGGNGTGSIGGGGPNDNVQAYNLLFDDAADFATPLFTQAVASPGFSNTDPAVLVNGGAGVSARYVRFDVTTTNGVNVGGSEFQFFTVPEPAAAVMLAVCALALGRFRSRR
jgi:hypothetical protein